MIIDIPNEDSKIFAVDNDDYWYVASKRGSLFQYVGIYCMFFLFWVYYLRISKGHCGGYKTIVRKPTKETRHGRIKTIIIGTVILCVGIAGTLVML